jgi:dTDP-glucose 4,6-dehydratase
MKLLVTGGCGFIGSNFIRHMLAKYPDCEITNLDALTYAGNLDNLKDLDHRRLTNVRDTVENPVVVGRLMRDADAVVNFAAESHVDRSIEDAAPFLRTNVMGLHTLLDAARASLKRRFVHISTDEVYGSLETDEGAFTETTPLTPNSPYSASKAAGDLLIRSYCATYGLPVIIIRPSNNYGPFQYPEKLIPLMITNLMHDKPVPIYGRGQNVRDWLFVEDNCSAIDLVLHEGKPGEVYNVGGENEVRNIDIAKSILAIMGKNDSLIEYVKDRPGHDYRYALDNSKIARELGWRPSIKGIEGFEKTVKWYMDNRWWWRPLKDKLTSESGGFWK